MIRPNNWVAPKVIDYKVVTPEDYKKLYLPYLDEWCAALLSGEYQQGEGLMKLIARDGQCYYCCLGVLCEMKGYASVEAGSTSVNEDKTGVKFAYDGEAMILSNSLAYEFGLTTNGMFSDAIKVMYIRNSPSEGTWTQVHSLAAMNDKGFTFEQIADVLQQLYTNDETAKENKE